MNIDLLITNGRVIDGTGSPWFWGDVGIRGKRICVVAPPRGLKAGRTIDAGGRVVCPGFIDMHTHSDLMPLVEPGHGAKVMQGVTTDVIGQDGLSYAPLTDETLQYFRECFKSLNGNPEGLHWDWRTVSEYLDRFDQQGVAINFAMLAPHGNIRAAVVGLENRAATADELVEMQRLLDQAMSEGAVGLSTGLTYAPCIYGNTHELVELCKVVARHGGYFAPHLRSYGAEMEAAVEEAIEICTKAQLPLHLTHFNASFSTGKGKAGYYIERIDRARREGLEVTADHYPYLAGSTFLSGILPGWVHEGGLDHVTRRLGNSQAREKIRHQLEVTGCDGMHGVPIEWDKIVLSDVQTEKNAGLVGLNIEEISHRLGKSPFDCFADLLIEEDFSAACIAFFGIEENVRQFMRHPAFMASSDGLLVGARPHPRAWGTFPKFLCKYVRELGVLTLENCIRKMTSLPARRLGFFDRGIIRPGMAADLVIFDPETVEDTASYENPRSYPLGIPFVIVNGQIVKDNDTQTDALPGRALRN